MASEVPGSSTRARERLVVLGGGIGAGKSSVADVFRDHGYTVISADEVGRDVLAPGSEAVDRVAVRWPGVVRDGVVDRGALAAIVFADATELGDLEAITHPAIRAAIRLDLDAHPGRPTVVEVPVMGVLGDLGAVRIAVVAPDDVRLARAVARGHERADAVARMASQPPQDAWREWADVVIDNSGPWLATRRLVEGLIDELATRTEP